LAGSAEQALTRDRPTPLLAAAALAPRSGQAGVVFHGMAGAGKTACALELAYTHQDSFPTMAWHAAPPEGHDIATALTDFALALERQLPGLKLVHLVTDTATLRDALPGLTEALEQNRVLIVLDNIESLLTGDGAWRDQRWGLLIDAITAHRGLSRPRHPHRPAGRGRRHLADPRHPPGRLPRQRRTRCHRRRLPQRHALDNEHEQLGWLVLRAARGTGPYLLRQHAWDHLVGAAQEVLRRDLTPGTAAEAATGADTELHLSRTHALALARLRPDQAETRLHQLLDTAAAQHNYHAASALAGDLVDLSRVLAGDRDPALADGLDPGHAGIVTAVLDHLAAPQPGE
jgi:hypothetical protein